MCILRLPFSVHRIETLRSRSHFDFDRTNLIFLISHLLWTMVHTLVEDQHDYRAIFGLIDISAPAVTINRQEEICDSPMRMNGTVLRRRRGSGVPVRSWLITSQACNLSILILGPSLRGQRSYESLSHDLSQFLRYVLCVVFRSSVMGDRFAAWTITWIYVSRPPRAEVWCTDAHIVDSYGIPLNSPSSLP